MKQWRLLNEGEEIREGDECFSLQRRWMAAHKLAAMPCDEFPLRRPLQTGWVKLSERKPTEGDADEQRRVIFRHPDGYSWFGTFTPIGGDPSHWHPLSKLEEKGKDEEAFEKWWNEYNLECRSELTTGVAKLARDRAKNGWDAALAHARSKK